MTTDNLPILTELKLAFVRCKTYGHSWDEFRSTGSTRPANLTLRCTRCSMQRYDTVSPVTGELVSRSYDRPPGFRTARLARSDLRVELLRRLKKRSR